MLWGILILVCIDRRCDKGGGTAFAIRKDVPFKVLDSLPDRKTEHQAIQIGSFVFVNNYAPPKIRSVNNYVFTINNFLPEADSLVMGYFNAHDGLWYINSWRASQHRAFNLLPGYNHNAAEPCLLGDGAARKKWDRVINPSSWSIPLTEWKFDIRSVLLSTSLKQSGAGLRIYQNPSLRKPVKSPLCAQQRRSAVK